jgi:hypothetical protein
LVKLHENDCAEDEDERGDEEKDCVQVDPSLIPEKQNEVRLG